MTVRMISIPHADDRRRCRAPAVDPRGAIEPHLARLAARVPAGRRRTAWMDAPFPLVPVFERRHAGAPLVLITVREPGSGLSRDTLPVRLGRDSASPAGAMEGEGRARQRVGAGEPQAHTRQPEAHPRPLALFGRITR